MVDRFNVLSLSGGGYLGLFTAAVLVDLEESAGHPIARRFDLLAGTSIGGILALGLAAEVPAKKIKEAFEKNGTSIFSERPATSSWLGTVRDLARYARRPKYRADALRATIAELVGADTRIGDLKHPIIVPAVNLTKGKPQVFKTPHHPNFRLDVHLKVVDVALATAAAPTYFPIAEIGDSLYVDGGLFANSPDILAIHEALQFFDVPIANIHLLSIGTTTSQFSFAHAHGRQLGWFGWWREQRLLNVMIASQQHSVDFMVGHRLTNRYLRLDAAQSKEQERHLALDVATEDAQKTLRGLAAATAHANINDPRLADFLLHVPPPPVFHLKI